MILTFGIINMIFLIIAIHSWHSNSMLSLVFHLVIFFSFVGVNLAVALNKLAGFMQCMCLCVYQIYKFHWIQCCYCNCNGNWKLHNISNSMWVNLAIQLLITIHLCARNSRARFRTNYLRISSTPMLFEPLHLHVQFVQCNLTLMICWKKKSVHFYLWRRIVPIATNQHSLILILKLQPKIVHRLELATAMVFLSQFQCNYTILNGCCAKSEQLREIWNFLNRKFRHFIEMKIPFECEWHFSTKIQSNSIGQSIGWAYTRYVHFLAIFQRLHDG